MQIGIDRGNGEYTVLLLQASRKGKTARALALQSVLRKYGRDASFGFCLHSVETGEPIVLEEIPAVEK